MKGGGVESFSLRNASSHRLFYWPKVKNLSIKIFSSAHNESIPKRMRHPPLCQVNVVIKSGCLSRTKNGFLFRLSVVQFRPTSVVTSFDVSKKKKVLDQALQTARVESCQSWSSSDTGRKIDGSVGFHISVIHKACVSLLSRCKKNHSSSGPCGRGSLVVMVTNRSSTGLSH
ncbi:hypothetical protein TNCV_4415861 [Trichonephila clavipes]|uniref:Uncharacterized protein n=1 Tax=Trichonephila clavipes TaxID=2585209 RepID=A0A8X6S0B4_TRICX|nr:hypothetical protein TNCV_4415861 [Trichonephila clavipes]